MAVAGGSGGGGGGNGNPGGRQPLYRLIVNEEDPNGGNNQRFNLFDWLDRNERRLNIAAQIAEALPDLEEIGDIENGGAIRIQAGRFQGQFGMPFYVRYNNNNHHHPAIQGGPQIQGGAIGGQMLPANNINVIVSNNVAIIYFTSKITHAYRRQNGESLRIHLNLRHEHVFEIMNVVNYINTIRTLCDCVPLADAIIAHIDVIQALAARNLQRAVAKQMTLLNCMRHVLQHLVDRGEEWCYQVIGTIEYDLQIILDRINNHVPAPRVNRVYLHIAFMLEFATQRARNGHRRTILQILQEQGFFRI